MGPKKKERGSHDEIKSYEELMRSDHEMFLQAFEKPTQIYRYLRTRHLQTPIFLHRTLSYMRRRKCRRKPHNHKKLRVDDILEQVQAKLAKNPLPRYKRECMVLTFEDFTEPDRQTLYAEVEVILIKICQKKRKDISPPEIEVNLGCATIPEKNGKVESGTNTVIEIGSEHFTRTNGHTVHSFMLHFRVTCTSRAMKKENASVFNGDIMEEDVPMRTRRQGPIPEHQCKKSSHSSCIKRDETDTTQYAAQLLLYDRHKRCLLPDGEYSLAVAQEESDKGRRQCSWESVMEQKNEGPFDAYNNKPHLNFQLSWAEPGSPQSEPSPPLVRSSPGQTTKEYTPIHIHPNRQHSICDSAKSVIKVEPPENRNRRVFYQFLYNNNTRQQTEARCDLRCPWCSLNCCELYSLLKHLRSCHPRYTFTCVEKECGATIDVTVNEGYDGSYVGNPHDLYSCIGFAFSRTGPVRRTPVTQILVYRPKKPSFDLSEFLEPELLDGHSRQFVQGHNRLYYHTLTCQPIQPQEIEYDSESEKDPGWLRQKTINLIEEFTDVNEGEKEIMKMWNLHVMHYNYIGDCSLPIACKTFIRDYGKEIIQKKLSRNLVLHLSNLCDFSLITAETFMNTVSALQRLEDSINSSQGNGGASPFISLAATDCNASSSLCVPVKPRPSHP